AKDDPETAKMLAQLGGSGSITDIYLAAVLSWLGMLAAGYAVQATLRLHSEEAELRAEQVLATAGSRVRWAGSHLPVVWGGPGGGELRAEQGLATAVSRIRWAGSHLLVVAVGSAVVLATGGLVAGLAHGLRAGDLGGE